VGCFPGIYWRGEREIRLNYSGGVDSFAFLVVRPSSEDDAIATALPRNKIPFSRIEVF
jgi:hypothetical protein